MKMSSKLAAGAGGLAAGIGLVAAVLCPVAGLVAGAYFTYGAVAATMATPAVVALTAAGAVGGLVVGRIAAPIVALGSLAVGGLVGLVAKGVTSIFDRESRRTGASFTDRQMMRALDEPSRFYGKASIAASFNTAGLEPAHENKQAPKPENKLFRRFSL